MLIAQISDFHLTAADAPLYGQVDTTTCLRACIDQVNALRPRPDVVLATGDLVHGGRPEDYARLRDRLDALHSPYLAIPGNHDDRAAFLHCFRDRPWMASVGSRANYVVEDYPLRLIALDTLDPGVSSGRLGEETLTWLDARLADAPDRPTLIFMHHPPFQTGIRYMDAIGLPPEDQAGLAAVVQRHGQIRKIVCGHLHRSIETLWQGVPASTAPSCAHQIALTLGPEPIGAFTREPPGFHLHHWLDGALVTHGMCVGDFAGPYSLRSGEPVAAS